MKNPKVFILTLLCLFALAACTHVEPVAPVGDKFDTFHELYAEAGVKAQSFTVDADLGGTFTGAQGIIVIVPPKVFRNQAGDTVKGDVTMRLKEFLCEKDMILSGLHTMSGEEILVSGGSFYLDAYQGTEELVLSYPDSITVQVPQVTRAEGFEDVMNAFAGNVVQEGFNTLDWQLIWELPLTQEQKDRAKLYSFSVRGFGFRNYDAFWRIPADVRTDLKTRVNGANTQSSRIMVIVKDYTIVADLRTFDGEGKKLRQPSFPVGLDIKLIAINLDDGELKFGALDTKSADNITYEVQVKPGTVKELEDLLENPF